MATQTHIIGDTHALTLIMNSNLGGKWNSAPPDTLKKSESPIDQIVAPPDSTTLKFMLVMTQLLKITLLVEVEQLKVGL